VAAVALEAAKKGKATAEDIARENRLKVLREERAKLVREAADARGPPPQRQRAESGGSDGGRAWPQPQGQREPPKPEVERRRDDFLGDPWAENAHGEWIDLLQDKKDIKAGGAPRPYDAKLSLPTWSRSRLGKNLQDSRAPPEFFEPRKVKKTQKAPKGYMGATDADAEGTVERSFSGKYASQTDVEKRRRDRDRASSFDVFKPNGGQQQEREGGGGGGGRERKESWRELAQNNPEIREARRQANSGIGVHAMGYDVEAHNRSSERSNGAFRERSPPSRGDSRPSSGGRSAPWDRQGEKKTNRGPNGATLKGWGD